MNNTEVQRWFELPLGFQVGVQSCGEFRMGAESGRVFVKKSDGSEWMNFGSYHFYFPNWVCYSEPAKWTNPLAVSRDGRFLCLNWLYTHVHGSMSPVLIDLAAQSYVLVAPRRILSVERLEDDQGMPAVICCETVWEQSQRRDISNVRVAVPMPLSPIAEFYALDPMSIDTDVYEWHGGELTTAPLRQRTVRR